MPTKKQASTASKKSKAQERTARSKSKSGQSSHSKPQAAEPATAPPVKSATDQFWSVVLFALGILLLLLTLISGSSAWLAIHKLLRGLFGIAVFFVPVILIYTAILISMDRSQETVAGRAIWGVGLTVLCSAIAQILIVGEIEGSTLAEQLKLLYQSGKDLDGGGLVSMLIAGPLLYFFDTLGAKIIVSLMLFVTIMLLTNLTLMDLFHLLAKPIRSAKHAMEQARLEDRYIEEYDRREAEAQAKYSEPQPAPAAPKPVKQPQPKDKSRQSRHSGFSMDIPITKRPLYPREEEFQMDIPLPGEKGYQPLKQSGQDTASSAEPAKSPVQPSLPKAKQPAQVESKAEEPIQDQKELEALIEQATAHTKRRASNPDELEQATEEIAAQVEQAEQEPAPPEYQLPPLDFLNAGISRANDPNAATELRQKADTLVNTLKSFGVDVRITGINRGPTVTRYEMQPAAGVKISKITSLSDDIALNLAAAGVRIEAPIPGKPAVGIEVPNENKDTVSLREILESPAFAGAKSKLTFAVGKNLDGKVVLGDIAKMPHMIIAGATGSGKSVCTNSIIMSILYHAKPNEVKLVLIDPKIVEFQLYDGIPHLLIPVVTDPKKAAGALNWAVQEMERRYGLCAACNVRDLASYNILAETREDLEPLPQIVVIIDEFADLMMTASKDVQDAVCRIAQKARAAGMHLIIATQRPTTDVITGLIKANIPSRIALSVMSNIDSRTILDAGGAEKLLGYGDMLYLPNGSREASRIQGCYCSTEEIQKVVAFVKEQSATNYSDEVIELVEQNIPTIKGDEPELTEVLSGDDALIEKAIAVAVDLEQLSTTALQRKLKLGYARAARIMDSLEEMGVIGPSEGAKPRRVLMTHQQYEERRLRRQAEMDS